MSRVIRVAAVQMAMSERMEDNCRRSVDYVRAAAEAGAGLVCFPEGQLSRYIAQTPGLKSGDYAVGAEHPHVLQLRRACRECGIIGCFSLCLREEEKVYAAMLLVDERGELLSVQKKKHIVRAPRFYERDYFTPGDGGFAVTETSIGRIGMILCFDRHYPESFRSLALQECELALVPAANDRDEPAELYQWEMRIPAFQNGMYTLMVNRVGDEGAMRFSGRSVFAGPEGELIAEADDREGLLLAELDLDRCGEARRRTQYLALRRPEVFC